MSDDMDKFFDEALALTREAVEEQINAGGQPEATTSERPGETTRAASPASDAAPDPLVARLRERARIRRQIPGRKSVQENARDRIADQLDEAADRIEALLAEKAKLIEERDSLICQIWISNAKLWDKHRMKAERERDEARRDADAKQAQIDRLMLEYCPDDMTNEQKENWAKHQAPVIDAEREKED